jgi:hypothetical protein
LPKAGPSEFCNTNPILMEKQMNLKRAFLILIAATLLPGIAFAQDDVFRIETTVKYDDDNPTATALVFKVCNGGLPLKAEATLGDDDSVTFITTDIDLAIGTVCTVTATFSGPYVADYIAGDDAVGVPGGCVFDVDVIEILDTKCLIELNPVPATVTVSKTWEFAGAGGDTVNTNSEFIAWSYNDVLVDGRDCLEGEGGLGGPARYCLEHTFIGASPSNWSFGVLTGFQGESVNIVEIEVDSSVESTNNCGGNVSVLPGSSASCDFTNTVFFESIPTLSQYGLAIMALLMLGVGFVGFRRFV